MGVACIVDMMGTRPFKLLYDRAQISRLPVGAMMGILDGHITHINCMDMNDDNRMKMVGHDDIFV